MPAYIRKLSDECGTHGCKTRASFEVVDQFNSSRGKFCRPHAMEKLRELRRVEARAAAMEKS